MSNPIPERKSEHVAMWIFYLVAIWAVVLWGVYFVENTKVVDNIANMSIEQVRKSPR